MKTSLRVIPFLVAAACTSDVTPSPADAPLVDAASSAIDLTPLLDSASAPLDLLSGTIDSSNTPDLSTAADLGAARDLAISDQSTSDMTSSDLAGPPMGAGIWWIGKSGSDSNSGRSLTQAFATFHKALTAMSSGDTLYVDDGVYNDSIGAHFGSYSSCAAEGIANGSAGRPTRVLAWHPHAAIIDGQYQRTPLQLFKCHDIEVGGLVFLHGGVVAIDHSSGIYIHQVGAAYCPSNDDNCSTISVAMSDHVTIEECWTWGYGGRYGIAAWSGHHNAFRRNVARYDGSVSGVAQPHAGIVLYSQDQSLAENNVVIDFDATGDDLIHDIHAPLFTTSSVPLVPGSTSPSAAEIAAVPLQPGYPLGLGSVAWYGNIVVNTTGATNAVMMIDSLSSVGGSIVVSNNVLANASGSAAVGLWASEDGGTAHTISLTHNTLYNLNSERAARVDYPPAWSSVTFSDSLIANSAANSSYGCFQDLHGGITAIDNQWFQCDPTVHDPVPGTGLLKADPQLRYLLRREVGAPGTSTNQPASDGGDRGATIIKRYATTAGSPANLSTINLWPFPNEAFIKQDLCAGPGLGPVDTLTADPSATQPGVAGTIYTRKHNTTGWCATTRSLTAYVWEQLGNPSPY